MNLKSLKDFIEYEQRVTNMLISHIKKENNDAIIQTENGPRDKGYDLAEVNAIGDLVNVYVICTYLAYKRNFHLLQQKLIYLESTTKAKAFLVYLNDSDVLCIVSISKMTVVDKEKTSNSNYVKTFLDFYTEISKICKDKGADLNFYFRGLHNKTFDPIPSIYRGNNIEKEDSLYREAVRRNPTEFTEDMSAFDNLVKMQHYELPTRLLDITSNPLVALYFACQKDDTKDGVVLVYSIMKEQLKYFDSDAVCILSNLAKCPIGFNFDEQKGHLVYDIRKDKPSFDGDYLEDDALHKVFCVLPKLNNNRIICQDGAFFIFGMGKTKKEPATLPDQPSKIIIKADAKKKILKELELLGIDEASLFPETDKVMKQIKLQFCD